jgi:hypothetical protein
LEGAEQNGTPTDFWGVANRVIVPIGMDPGVAHFVVKRDFANSIDKNGLHEFTWTYTPVGGTAYVRTFSQWTLVQADCTGLDGDSQAAYLLEFRDKRHLLAKGELVNRAYNVTVPKHPIEAGTDIGDWREWLAGTTAGGAIQWTWQEVLEDLWGLLDGALAGVCPTLAWVPSHEPFNLRFYDISAWEAIGELLECCNAVLVPTAIGFDAYELGEAQSSLAGHLTALAGRYLFDGKPLPDLAAAHCPETISVLFPRREWDQSGVPPAHNYEGKPHKVDIATGIGGAVGTLEIWSDLPAEVNTEGDIENETACDDAADELALTLSNRLENLTDQRELEYSGLVQYPDLGPEIHEICYRDYGDGDGLRTELRSLWRLRWPERPRQPHIGHLLPIPPGIYLGLAPAGGIPARSGLVLGSADCELRQIESGSISATSREATVYNLCELPVNEGDYFFAAQETVTGMIVVSQANGWAKTGYMFAEATLVGNICGTEGENIEVTGAILLPSCASIDLSEATITNTMRHMGPGGSKVRLIKSCAAGSGSGSGTGSGSGAGDVWDITEVEKRPLCVVHEVKDNAWCLTQIVVRVAAEWCEDPDSACVVVLYTDCEDSGDCDTSISFTADTCCANEPGSGSGSGSGV